MTKDEIINSSAFKVINMLIDRNIKEIEWEVDYLQRMFTSNRPHTYSRVGTRISYEDYAEKEVRIKMDVNEIHSYRRSVANIAYYRDEIRKLQTVKLELLNDYDFTHGDLTTHKKIFGEGSIVE